MDLSAHRSNSGYTFSFHPYYRYCNSINYLILLASLLPCADYYHPAYLNYVACDIIQIKTCIVYPTLFFLLRVLSLVAIDTYSLPF